MTFPNNNSVGLVMEGGAQRGLFTAGVLDVLMEHGVHFPAAVGVSAGAAFGCNLKSRQIGRVLRYNLKYCRDWRYCSFRSLAKTGDLFGADFCYRAIPKELDPFDEAAFDRDPMAFYAVCTDVETGEAVYHRCDKIADHTYEWIQASASMPFVSRPVEIEGRLYLDGGIADAIPMQFMLDIGWLKNLVILTRPRDYVKEKSSTPKKASRVLREHPKLAEAMDTRHLRYQASRELVFRLEQAGAAIVICPDEPLPIDRVTHDPGKLHETWVLGRRAARAALPKLLSMVEGESRPLADFPKEEG